MSLNKTHWQQPLLGHCQ